MIVSCNKDEIIIKFGWPMETAIGDRVCNERKGFALATNDIDRCCERVNGIHIIFQYFFRLFLRNYANGRFTNGGKIANMCVAWLLAHINNLFDNFRCIFNAMSVEII